MNTTYSKQKINCIINVSKIVTIHYFEFDRNFHSHGEKHDFWEIVYIDRGEADIEADGRKFTLRQGNAVFHKPNEFHIISSNGQVAPNVFIITFVCRSKAMEYFKDKQLNIPTTFREYITNIVSEAENTYHLGRNNPHLTKLVLKDNAPLGGEQLIKLNLEMLLISLLRRDLTGVAKHIKSDIKDTVISEVIDYIHQNIYGKISVEDICNKFNFSRSYISARFKKYCNMTINEYINKIKTNQAKIMIREEKHSISQISEMLCYSNPYYFSRVFRKVTGMSPREYKQSVKI